MLVEVIDRVCGDGKTSDMVKEVKNKYLNGADEKYIIITPYLSECHSISGTKSVEGDEYQRPQRDENGKVIYTDDGKNLAVMKFKHPTFNNKEGSKAASLKYLMNSNQNIVSTHNLFLNVKLDTLDNADKYTLIVDEALDVFSVCTLIPRKETKKLLKLNILELLDDGITLKFNRDKFGSSKNLFNNEDAVKDTRYEEVAALCDNSQLLLVNGNVLMWELSSEILKRFKRVVILTYLFEGREMSIYLKKHNIPYKVFKGERSGKDYKDLITLVQDPKLNAVGDGYYALSATSTRTKVEVDFPSELDYDTECEYLSAIREYKENKKSAKKQELSASDVNDQLRRNLKNVMHNKWGAKKKDRYFTCLSDNEKVIADKSFKGEWLGFSTKATNEFRDRHHVAFLMNPFIQPYLKQICNSTDYEVNEDLVALSHLVQFIFRSGLRQLEPIQLYVPSSRMRKLLEDYLEGKYD